MVDISGWLWKYFLSVRTVVKGTKFCVDCHVMYRVENDIELCNSRYRIIH